MCNHNGATGVHQRVSRGDTASDFEFAVARAVKPLSIARSINSLNLRAADWTSIHEPSI